MREKTYMKKLTIMKREPILFWVMDNTSLQKQLYRKKSKGIEF